MYGDTVQTAKFKSANTQFGGQTTKFNDRQYFWLYGMCNYIDVTFTLIEVMCMPDPVEVIHRLLMCTVNGMILDL